MIDQNRLSSKLDSSYEATPSFRLDLVLRQQGRRIVKLYVHIKALGVERIW